MCGAARNLQADVDLEGIIDPPLQSGEGTNHDDTQREAASEESHPSHFADDAAHRRALWQTRQFVRIVRSGERGLGAVCGKGAILQGKSKETWTAPSGQNTKLSSDSAAATVEK